MSRINKWIYQLALRFISNRIHKGQDKLTRHYLYSKGWIVENEKYWVEPDIKDRDKIWIEFGDHYYRVWHGPNRTFIALESSLEWFEVYYMLHAYAEPPQTEGEG